MARLATSQRASELFERMRGVGLGSQTHGLSGVHHIQVRAQAARVHLVNAGVVAVYQCCVWDATLGDAKLVKRPELARSLVLNAAADSHSRLREPLHGARWMGPGGTRHGTRKGNVSGVLVGGRVPGAQKK